MNAPAEPVTLIPTRANIQQATNITVDSLGLSIVMTYHGYIKTLLSIFKQGIVYW
jgi:hypothetical protein